jgi:triacylglycerol lipase
VSRLLIAALLLVGCGSRGQDRCQQIKAELDACIGASLPALDCTTLSDADLDRVHDLTTGVSCELLTGALPLDGDYLSATCRLLDVGCVTAITPAPAHSPARLPIVLVNGIDTSPLFRYSDRIVQMLREVGGHDVYLATLPAYQPPRKRAPLLWARIQEIQAASGTTQVNLVCHSLGGLDCRYLVSPAGLPADLGDDAPARAVASITTVATAHRGTAVADALLGLLPGGDQAQTIDDFASLVGDWFSTSALASDADLYASLGALTLDEARSFDDEITDANGIYYQSFAGVSQPRGEASAELDAQIAADCAADPEGADITGPLLPVRHDHMALPLVPLAPILGRQQGREVANDGLVTVASAKWGNFRGCVAADHMEQLGQRDLPDVNVRTGFDVARFYSNLAGDLARRGY